MRAAQPADYPGCPQTITTALEQGVCLVPTRWGVRDAFIAAAGALLMAVFVGLALASLNLIGTGTALLIGAAAPWIVMAGWPLYATSKYGNGARLDLGLRINRRDIGIGVVAGLSAIVLGLVAAAITAAIVGDFGSAAGDAATAVAESSPAWQLFLFALLVVIGAPFVEELLFRGLLWAGLRRIGWGRWLTGITSVLVFSLFHFEITRLGVLLVIGTVLAVARARSGALGAPIIAHAINNLPGAIGIATLG